MESDGLKFCSPGANEKEKQEGNPLREVTNKYYATPTPMNVGGKRVFLALYSKGQPGVFNGKMR